MTAGELILILPSQPEAIGMIRDCLGRLARWVGFTPQEDGDLKLAVNEVYANTIKHAYGGDRGKKVVLKLLYEAGKIQVRVRNFGPKPEIKNLKSRALDRLDDHGLGIFLIESLTDEVRFDISPFRGVEVILTKIAKFKKEKGREEMKTEVSLKDGVVVIAPSGELDISNSALLKEAIAEQARRGRRKVLIDLDQVSYMDSSALGALISGMTTLKKEQGDLKVSGLNENIERIFQLTGLNQFLNVYKNREEALQGF